MSKQEIYNVRANGSIEVVTKSVVSIKSKRQRMVLESLRRKSAEAAIAYLKTFAGDKHRSQDRVAMWSAKQDLVADGVDILKTKRAGSILRQFEERFNATTSHVPSALSKGDWIGVEIECFIPYDSVNVHPGDFEEYDEDGDPIESDDSIHERAADEARQVLARRISAAKIARCTVKDDGSIDSKDSSEYFPVEVTILFKRDEKAPLEALCNLLNKHGAQVNASCGLHVHLDCRDLIYNGGLNRPRLNKRATRLGNAVQALALMVPRSRRDNRFCRLGVSDFRGERYFAVNKTAAEKFGTIEVRLHSGTTNFEKISNWVNLLHFISRCKHLTHYEALSIEALIGESGMPSQLAAYVVNRASIFDESLKALTVEGDDEDDAVAA